MAGIVDAYRKHKDLLSVYFASEEAAADCERRAEMGDDRAIVKLFHLYSLTEVKQQMVHDNDNPYGAKRDYHARVFLDDYLNFKKKVEESFSPDGLPLDIATQLGCRTIEAMHPVSKAGAPESEALLPVVSDAPSDFIDTESVMSNDTRFDLTSNDISYYKYGYTTLGGIFSAGKLVIPNQQVMENYLNHLKLCAMAGDVRSAIELSRTYAPGKLGYANCPEYIATNKRIKAENSSASLENSRLWQRIAEHLEGKSATPLEREKFLQEFLYSQDSTPEGLYNIGYALYHNEHIGDKARGLDYLKHAANLGDANAARELGEIYHNAFDAHGNKVDLETAHFWYKVAAETPMAVTINGKKTDYDGHPNAKARVAYLEKAHPELAQSGLVDESALRNPSPQHIAQYPASAWYVDVPITDVSNLIKNTDHGKGIVQRMESAVHAIDSHVAEFERMTSIIQARMDDLAARQLVMDGRVDNLKGEEISALRQNDALSREQMTHERLAQLSHDRWVKETINNLGATVALGVIFAAIPAGPGLAGMLHMAPDQSARLLAGNMARASGFRGARDNEVAYRQALIEELESRKIDTSKFPDEITALAKQVQALADSKPMQNLLKDETRARALVEGYLRQKILKSGLDNCRSLDDYATQNGLESVDALLEDFATGDARLYSAINNLCYGHANSNDMEVILADANAMRGNELPPHEKAFKQFVERVVKGNIGHFMTRASQIDVIDDLKLVNFDTMSVDHRAATADLVRGVVDLSPAEQGARQVDAATKMALTTMFSKQFGVTHIGQYDVTRMFSFYLHRHGRNELIASELHDGTVSDELATKRVSLRTPKEMRGFVERAKASATRGRDDQPNVGDLFLRVCGYEYYLPQAVITSGRGNRFKENPEAPVAYPMVNRVVQSFIEKMSLGDLPSYREKIGEELDSVIAQTFIDFFNHLGREHTEKFAKDREYLRDAHAHDNYGPRFDTYEDKITTDAMGKFSLFMQLYERNLRKEMATAPEDIARLLQQQLGNLDQTTQDYLAPAVAKPGSFKAREEARLLDHRGSNMTENWKFGSY